VCYSAASCWKMKLQYDEFLSHVSTLMRDIDIAMLSVCVSVRPSVCP